MAYNPVLQTVDWADVVNTPVTLVDYGVSQTDNGTLLNGVMPIVVTPKTANYTLTAGDFFILVNSTSGNITITLPTTVVTGKVFAIKKTVAANSVILDPSGSATIDGAANFTFTTQYETIWVIFDGTNFFIL